METYTNPQNAQVIDISGDVRSSLATNLLQVGDTVESGAVLMLAKNSEITVVLADGSHQRVYSSGDELSNEILVENVSVAGSEKVLENSSVEDADMNNIQNEIEAIQDLIASEDDVELPDTAAGVTSNEGTSFVTVDRTGDETLAEAGYDTSEQQNSLPEIGELDVISLTSIVDDDEAVSTDEDTLITGNTLNSAQNSDLAVTGFEVNGVTYAVGSTASLVEGELTLNSDGSYTFLPSDNYNGDVPVATYTVENSTGDRDISTLSIVVEPVIDLADDEEIVSNNEDTTITGDVLINASSPDDPLSVTGFEVGGETYEIGDTANLEEGDLTLNEDGSYTFVPTENYNGPVPVATYTVLDGAGDQVTSTLTIVIDPVSDLIDEDEVVSIEEDTTLTGNVLNNASSPDNPLSVNGFEIGGETYNIGDTAILDEGELTINSDGSYTFVPADDYHGDVPVATYTVEDGAGDTDISTLTITVQSVKDLTDDDEVVSIDEDTTVTGNVLNNASSPDEPLTVTDFEIGGVTYAIGATASIVEGDLTINADGSYSFVPSENYNGDVPVATYTVEDGAGDTDISTLTITVNPVSDLTDGDEAVRINENTSAIGNVLNNASTPDNPLSVTDFTVGGTQYAIGSTAVLSEGNLTINANGSYVFVPSNDYVGVVPVATYTVTDGAGDTDLSSLRITVDGGGNIPPVAADDSFSVDQGETVSGNVITHNDGDGVVDTDGGDGAALTVTHVNGNALVFDAVTGYATVTLATGTLLINAQGEFDYTDTSNDGSNASFNYTLSDGTDSDTADVTITVEPSENIPPVAADDSFSVDQGETVSGNVITHNDGDGVVDTDGGDGATLTVTHVNGNALVFDAVTGFATVTLATGTLLINAQGEFDYTDTSNDGSNASFNYTLSDGTDSDTADVTITVEPSENIPPVAADDSFSVDQGETVSGNVITHNDGDGVVDTDGGDGATLTVTHVNGNALVFDAVTGFATVTLATGTLLINAQGEFDYTDTSNDGSNASFNYTLSDGTDSDTADVTITVEPLENIPPVAADDSFSVDQGETVSGNVITHNDGDGVVDTDGGDGATLTVTHVNGNALVFDASTGYATITLTDGTLRINAQGGFDYTDTSNDGSNASFNYTLSDGTDSDTADVTITVEPLENIPPVAADDSFSVDQGETVSGNVITHNDGDGVVDTDGGDGATLTVTHVNGNALVFDVTTGYATVVVEGGNLTINAQGQFTYHNSEGFVLGSAYPSFEYTVSDGTDSDIAEVVISVNDTAPLAVDDNNYVNYKDNEGLSVTTAVRGIILKSFAEGGSTGDRADSSPDGTVILTQVEFDGQVYAFDATNTSYNIITDFGRFIIDNQGEYFFILDAGIDITTIPSSLQFDYTIKDGDALNAETDDAVLTIHLEHITSGGRAANSNDEGELIDLSFSEQVTDFRVQTESNVFNTAPDLSDLFAHQNDGNLDNYLAFNGLSESEGENTPDEVLTLESVELNNIKGDEETIVTNGFLNEGATILSDSTPEHLPKQTEFDSSDIL